VVDPNRVLRLSMPSEMSEKLRRAFNLMAEKKAAKQARAAAEQDRTTEPNQSETAPRLMPGAGGAAPSARHPAAATPPPISDDATDDMSQRAPMLPATPLASPSMPLFLTRRSGEDPASRSYPPASRSAEPKYGLAGTLVSDAPMQAAARPDSSQSAHPSDQPAAPQGTTEPRAQQNVQHADRPVASQQHFQPAEQRPRQHLDGDGAVEADLLPLEDDRHPADADAVEQAVLADDEARLPREEPLGLPAREMPRFDQGLGELARRKLPVSQNARAQRLELPRGDELAALEQRGELLHGGKRSGGDGRTESARGGERRRRIRDQLSLVTHRHRRSPGSLC
jgi:hypothetical protein